MGPLPISLLNVDADDTCRYAVSQMLRKAGFHVREAATADDALNQTLEQPPDLVVLNYGLPDFGGDLCTRLKNDPHLGSPPVLLLLPADFGELNGHMDDFDAVLCCPAQPAELLSAVKMLLRLRLAEDAAVQASHRETRVLESTTDAFYLVDPDGCFAYVNQQAERALGWSRAELLGKRVWELFPQGIGTVFHQKYLEAVTRRERVEFEEFCPALRRWLEFHLYPSADGLAVYFRDVTARKEVEHGLRESEERFRQLAENIDEVFWMADGADERLIYVSPAYEEVWGRPVQSLYDDPASWREAIHVEDRARMEAALRKRAAEGDYDVQFRIVRPDASVRWIRDRAFPVRNSQGERYRLVGIAEDVTDRKRLEEQFRQAQKMEAIGRLAGGVAHDFNNVLTAITGYSELIMQDAPAPDHPQYHHADEIRRAAERAASLTRQLLAYSRQQVLAPRVLNLNTVVADMEKMLRRLLREDITLKITLAPPLRRVEADPGQVEQVVMNLVVNACDAMPHGGNLTIHTANVELDEAYAWSQVDVQPGAYVLLAVTDTGQGMTEEVRQRLFEPFFTTKDVGKGTGLGLSTVYGIVKQSGGHIDVISAPGRGATFKVYLPQVMELDRPSALPRGPSKTPSGSETVLLVEDEDVVRALARTVLARHGYRVLEARHGVEALDVCSRHEGPIQLLVTDVVMPHMNGPDLAQELLRLRPATRVLYVSGYTGLVNDLRDLPGTEAAFLQKPFAPDALARQVRALLDR